MSGWRCAAAAPTTEKATISVALSAIGARQGGGPYAGADDYLTAVGIEELRPAAGGLGPGAGAGRQMGDSRRPLVIDCRATWLTRDGWSEVDGHRVHAGLPGVNSGRVLTTGDSTHVWGAPKGTGGILRCICALAKAGEKLSQPRY